MIYVDQLFAEMGKVSLNWKNSMFKKIVGEWRGFPGTVRT